MSNPSTKLQSGTVSPAYGRDYFSAETVVHAFINGEDFKNHSLVGGSYCSARDFAKGATVSIRYNKMKKQTVITY